MHFLINGEGYWLAPFLLTVSTTNTFLKILQKFWKKVLFKKTSVRFCQWDKQVNLLTKLEHCRTKILFLLNRIILGFFPNLPHNINHTPQIKPMQQLYCVTKKQPSEVLLKISQNSQRNTCASLLFTKVAGLRLATLLKKSLCHRCFPANFSNFLRTPSLKSTYRRLLLVTAGWSWVFFKLIH